MVKLHVIVIAEPGSNGRVNVSVGQPEGEPKLSFEEMSHILVSGISLLVKLVNEQSEKKDYELMGEIIYHLNQEFVSLTSFNDAEIVN